jgi:deoxyribodipyrimidine photo-lyase
MKPSIVWFRQDLRLEDQPALAAAVQKGGAIIPVFIWAPDEEGEWIPGAASRWWLYYSLAELQQEFQRLGIPFIIRFGSTLPVLMELIQATDADAVFWNRRYEPHIIQRDAFIRAELHKQGVKALSFNGHLLFEPWLISHKNNKPIQVFNSFWKHCLTLGTPESLIRKPTKMKHFIGKIESEPLSSLNLLPKVHWDTGLEAIWEPGEKGAKKKLNYTLKHVISTYDETRDRPDLNGVSHLSPYLHYGNISPRAVWHAIQRCFDSNESGPEAFLRQLGWREFAYYMLYYFPETTHEPLRKDFRSFPWEDNYRALRDWQNGKTGYPIVDAGMRQLWQTGWMHNRVRMVVASFLVKDLLIHWQEGTKWFWDTLVDADLANNTFGWQWVAGCGADAAPYFRVFNPVIQGEKFDLTGDYVRQWIPELRALPNKWLHKPWEAPSDVLKEAKVILGETYPFPIVNHAEARELALEAYAKL